MVLQHRDYLDTRSQRAAQHVDRLGGGDAGTARRGRARVARREDVGELRPHRRRQPVPRAARRPAGAARQRRRARARHRGQAGRRRRQRAPSDRRASDPQPLCLPRLSQPAGDHARRSSSTAGCAPAMFSTATATASTIFRSRVDDMFSCGGENIYPKEVENLLFTHPDVADAVVAPVPHAVKGFVPAAMVIAARRRDGHRRRAQGASASSAARSMRIPATSGRADAAAERRRQDRPRRGPARARVDLPDGGAGRRLKDPVNNRASGFPSDRRCGRR